METRVYEDTWVPTYCYQCNTGPCPFRVRRVNGVAISIEGNPAFKDYVLTGARVCVKALGLIQKLYNPYRIKRPLKRTNPEKGRGIDPKWVEISWDEALELVAAKLTEVRARGVVDEQGHARLAMTTGADGTPRGLQGTLDAFAAAWGPVDQSLGAGGGAKCEHSEHIYGEMWHKGFLCGSDTPLCNYLISGHNTNASGGVPGMRRHAEARVRGIKRVQIEPHLSVTGATSDEWIPIRPKTDAALFFAMVHVILHEFRWQEVCDIDFLKRMTNSPYLVGPDGCFVREKTTAKPLVWDRGENRPRAHDEADIKDLALEGTYPVDGIEARPAFHLLQEHMARYTPAWAAPITGVPEKTIRRLAREFVDNAQVGATIEVENAKLPYRPVAVVLGKSVNNGPGGYATCWAQHVLQVLVGALEVPGGLLGSLANISGSVAAGPDGFPDYRIIPVDPEHWQWPPRSRDGLDCLTPLVGDLSRATLGPAQLAWLNLKSPPERWPPAPPPDIWFTYKTNPAISMWDTSTVIEGIKKVPFFVSFGYTLDETNELADVILPDNMDLEGLQIFSIGATKQWENYWDHMGFVLRQPVVDPPYDTRDMTDICTELAERVGILKEYNAAINGGSVLNIPLRGPSFDYGLDPGTKHRAGEIWDRLCKAATMLLTDGREEHGLAWFKEHSACLIPYSRISEGKQIGSTRNRWNRPWYLHEIMKQKGLRYQLPYQEQIKKIGEELGRRLHANGIHWWDVQLQEYEALPRWHDFPALYDTGPEFDLWLTTCRTMQYAWGGNVGLPLMAEAAQQVLGHNGIMINSKTAASRGIKHGDEIWVESPSGKIKARAVVREGIHPEVLVATQQFGHWRTPVARELGWPNMNPLTPISYKLTDKTGSASDEVKVKVYKET